MALKLQAVLNYARSDEDMLSLWGKIAFDQALYLSNQLLMLSC